MGKLASAIRLVAARESAGLSQTQLAEKAGIKTQSLNNMERARQFPTREVMRYLSRAHGMDFNFLMNGDFHQFSPSVQDQLFEKLVVAIRDLDPSEDLDLPQMP